MEVRKASEMTKVGASSRSWMVGGSAEAATSYDATGVSTRLGAWVKEGGNGVGNSSIKQTACRLRHERAPTESVPAWRTRWHIFHACAASSRLEPESVRRIHSRGRIRVAATAIRCGANKALQPTPNSGAAEQWRYRAGRSPAHLAG